MTTDWDSLFDPRVVAVVGASADPRRIGGRLIRYSVESGFAGRVIPVNPHRDELFGLPVRKSLADLDETPDWVVVALPRDRVADAVEQAGRLGARNVSVVAAGFAETGEAGHALQRRLADIAAAHGMRLLGPNSNGFMNVASGAYFAFTPVIDSARPVPGDLAIVTQSAAIGTYLINWCRQLGVGVRHWLHTGNEADLTVLEIARALAERGGVRALALSFESLRDLDDLHDTLLTLARAGIATAVLQAGTSEIGRIASQAHTAALIGAEADLLGDLVESAGAYAATSIAGLVNVLQVALDHPTLPPAPRLGLVSTSGGIGVLMADAAERHGIAMPRLSTEVQERIRAYAPFAHPANPVDTTAQVINDPDALPRILTDCVDSGELDVLAVFIAHGLAGAGDRTLTTLADTAAQRPGKALAGLGVLTPDAAAALRATGVSVFTEPVELTAALRAAADSAVRRAAFATRTPAGRRAGTTPGEVTLLDEVAGKRLLQAGGATIAPGDVPTDADAAVGSAERLGYPVVVKLVSPSLPHKAAHGGVRLNVWTADAVRAAYADLDALGHAVAPGGHVVLVERQLTGIEVFVGVVRHPTLGTLVGIGPGGGDVEHAGAVRWHWAPVSTADIHAALPRPATEEHATAVARLVETMTALDAPTAETNPVFLTADGRAVVADALIEREIM
ncbi:acetate--CoA ligase family protein [Asanoa iriomotensis]|uniref:Pimeloyl-CoA synthetase n=1 Tax=Asanoa iriomotensis TaxID=234613 RepID=A0ABQ4C075_9ACTN|nr:acetate--CoA ligase family protein [Asanoa iriomotensis]GIF56174.1 pimeloyl-CoA synthetase [Asanoa iriomotensis]